jgi:hypothetical protein
VIAEGLLISDCQYPELLNARNATSRSFPTVLVPNAVSTRTGKLSPLNKNTEAHEDQEPYIGSFFSVFLAHDAFGV